MKIATGDVDLNKVETGIPILSPGDYDVKVISMEVVRNKANDGDILDFKLGLVDSARARDGQTVNPNFPIFGRASLKVTDKYDPVKRHLVPMMDCFLGTRPAEFETDDFIGKEGRIRLSVRNDEVYGESNEIKGYVAKK